MFFVLAGRRKPRREFWFLDPHYLLPFFCFLFLWGLNWIREEATGPLWWCQPRWQAHPTLLSSYHIWISNKLLKIMYRNKKLKNINWHGVVFMGTLFQVFSLLSINVWQKIYIYWSCILEKSHKFLETQSRAEIGANVTDTVQD